MKELVQKWLGLPMGSNGIPKRLQLGDKEKDKASALRRACHEAAKQNDLAEYVRSHIDELTPARLDWATCIIDEAQVKPPKDPRLSSLFLKEYPALRTKLNAILQDMIACDIQPFLVHVLQVRPVESEVARFLSLNYDRYGERFLSQVQSMLLKEASESCQQSDQSVSADNIGNTLGNLGYLLELIDKFRSEQASS